MAILVTQTISQAGLSPGLQACSSGGDSWTPGSSVFLIIKNADSGSHLATIATTAVAYGQPISNIAVTLPGASEVFVGPFDPGEVQQSGSSLANLTYDSSTYLTIAAVECPSV